MALSLGLDPYDNKWLILGAVVGGAAAYAMKLGTVPTLAVAAVSGVAASKFRQEWRTNLAPVSHPFAPPPNNPPPPRDPHTTYVPGRIVLHL